VKSPVVLAPTETARAVSAPFFLNVREDVALTVFVPTLETRSVMLPAGLIFDCLTDSVVFPAVEPVICMYVV
jgi:hypothetical protein